MRIKWLSKTSNETVLQRTGNGIDNVATFSSRNRRWCYSGNRRMESGAEADLASLG